MRWKVIPAAVLALWSLHVSAGALHQSEVDELKADIAALMGAFERGDPEPFIAKTHDSILKLAGGPAQFAAATRAAVAQLGSGVVAIVESEIGQPTVTYPAGNEEVCFVPRVTVAEVQGQRVKSTTFMIAIRDVPDGAWTYLDGAGLRKNPGLLYVLLPELERGIELPPNVIEPM